MTEFRFLRRSMTAGILAGAVMLALPSTARAAYAVEVFDDGVLQGGISVTIIGNSLTFSGSTTHFSISNGTGTSNNPGGAAADLTLATNEQVTTTFGTAGGTHTIAIVLSQTDFTQPTGTPLMLSSSAGGSFANLGGSTMVSSTYQGFFNDNNSLFGTMQGTPVQTASGSSTSVGTTPLVYAPSPSTSLVTGGVPFSITDMLSFTFTLGAGSGQTTANASVSTDVTPAPVPEPASMTLLGTGLFGLAAAYRRRRAAK